MKIKKIIFICTGNTCRSPMAQVIAQQILIKKKYDIDVISRGISVIEQQKANKQAINVVSKYNHDLSQHITSAFNIKDVDEHTLILTMTKQHKQILQMYNKDIINQIFSLHEYINENGSIKDPYGQSLLVYEQCYTQLQQIIGKIFNKIESEEIL